MRPQRLSLYSSLWLQTLCDVFLIFLFVYRLIFYCDFWLYFCQSFERHCQKGNLEKNTHSLSDPFTFILILLFFVLFLCSILFGEQSSRTKNRKEDRTASDRLCRSHWINFISRSGFRDPKSSRAEDIIYCSSRYHWFSSKENHDYRSQESSCSSSIIIS